MLPHKVHKIEIRKCSAIPLGIYTDNNQMNAEHALGLISNYIEGQVLAH